MQYNILVLRNDFFFKKSMNLTKTDYCEDNWHFSYGVILHQLSSL